MKLVLAAAWTIFFSFVTSSAHADWKNDLFWLLPGVGYSLTDLSERNQGYVLMHSVWRTGVDCDSDSVAALQPNFDLLEDWQETIDQDLASGITGWSNSKEDPNRNKMPQYIDAIEGLKVSLSYEVINRCAAERGFGTGSKRVNHSMQKWVSARIREYEEYLPKVFCDEEVHSWMQANYELATELMPLIKAGRAEGVGTWYEWSPLTNSKYLMHKKLDDNHNKTYKRQGKVMRRAAKQCEGVPRPIASSPKITAQEALNTCDALGFERETEAHSNCALEVLTRD
ncbi:hypothetical protein N9Y37_07655 [Luminiphilus sp.]|nr:hypothetical protein [Luminiphilus sp.]